METKIEMVGIRLTVICGLPVCAEEGCEDRDKWIGTGQECKPSPNSWGEGKGAEEELRENRF